MKKKLVKIKNMKWTLLICLLFFPLQGFSEEERAFTLSQAIQQALQANPNLRATQFQTEEALFNYRTSRALPNLLLNGNYTGGNNAFVSNNGRTQDFNLTLQQSFGPIGSVSYAGQAAYHGYEASLANFQQARVILVQNVKDSFFSLLSAQEQLRIAEENLLLANELFSLVEKKFNAGASPRTDLLNAEVQTAASLQGKIQAEIARKQAQNTLALVLGFPQPSPLQVAGTLDLVPLTTDLSEFKKRAEQNHPAIVAAQKILRQAEAQTNFAKSQRNPSPSLFYNYDLSITPLYMIGASLQFPIFDYGQIRNQIKVQEKTIQEKQNALQAARLAVFTSLKTAYETYQAAYVNASTYREKVLVPSEELMKVTRFGYKEGAIPYVQVVLAEQNLRTVTLQYVTLLLTAHQAMDALEAATGEFFGGGIP